jgi:hypothetical protein
MKEIDVFVGSATRISLRLRARDWTCSVCAIALAVPMLSLRAEAAVAQGNASGDADVSLRANRLTFDGIGPLRIGSKFSQLEPLKLSLSSQDHVRGDELGKADCTNSEGFLKGIMIGVLLVAGRVRRIDVLGPGIATEDGIQVNSTEGDARRIFGRRLVQYKWDGGGANRLHAGNPGHSFNPHYLAVESLNGRSILLMETDGTDVMAIHIGPKEVFWSTKDVPFFAPTCEMVRENGGWHFTELH